MQTSFESPLTFTCLKPFSRAYFSPKITPLYSATLLVATPTPSRNRKTYRKELQVENLYIYGDKPHLLNGKGAYHTSICSTQHGTSTSWSRIPLWSPIKLKNAWTLYVGGLKVSSYKMFLQVRSKDHIQIVEWYRLGTEVPIHYKMSQKISLTGTFFSFFST